MQNLDWKEIGFDSKSIERIAYSENNLYVEFKRGSRYRYLNVPFEIFQRIMNKECISKSEGKPSYGSTLDILVKKAGYQYQPF